MTTEIAIGRKTRQSPLTAYKQLHPKWGGIGILAYLVPDFTGMTIKALLVVIMDAFSFSRRKSSVIVTVYTLIAGVIVCLGYNVFYFEWKLPNGTVAQILDVFDYVSNFCLMPIVAFLTCILIGWVVKPDVIIEEVTQGKIKFGRKGLYVVMVKFVAPILLLILLLQSLGVL